MYSQSTDIHTARSRTTRETNGPAHAFHHVYHISYRQMEDHHRSPFAVIECGVYVRMIPVSVTDLRDVCWKILDLVTRVCAMKGGLGLDDGRLPPPEPLFLHVFALSAVASLQVFRLLFSVFSVSFQIQVYH